MDEADPLAWSADGVEQADSYAALYAPGSDDDLRFRFMRRLVVSARRWRGHIDQRLRRMGQSQARWEMLVSLALRDRPTQSELARRLSIEAPTVARMLTTLEQDGDIARLGSGSDRRQRVAELTPQGEKALAAAQLIVDLLREGVLRDLDREELEMGLRIFDKVLARLEMP